VAVEEKGKGGGGPTEEEERRKASQEPRGRSFLKKLERQEGNRRVN